MVTSFIWATGQTRQGTIKQLKGTQMDVESRKRSQHFKDMLWASQSAYIPIIGKLWHSHIWVQVWKHATKHKSLLVHKQCVVPEEHHPLLASLFQWEDLGLLFFLQNSCHGEKHRHRLFPSVTHWIIENSLPTSATHTASREIPREGN